MGSRQPLEGSWQLGIPPPDLAVYCYYEPKGVRPVAHHDDRLVIFTFKTSQESE